MESLIGKKLVKQEDIRVGRFNTITSTKNTYLIGFGDSDSGLNSLMLKTYIDKDLVECVELFNKERND